MVRQTGKDILQKLKAMNCFWSYSEDSVEDVPDDILIEKSLLYLDLPEIDAIFQLYPYKKVKKVWMERMIPQGDYLYTLNKFLAWYYFCIKQPDRYLKSMLTRHFNKMLK